MNFNEYFEAEQQNMGPHYHLPHRPNSLATASLVCGVVAVVSIFICPVVLTCIFGPISILLALLSKGYDAKMHNYAKIGIITSISGISMNIMMYSIIIALFIYSPNYREAVIEYCDQTFEMTYGMDFNETMQQIYGEDFDINKIFGVSPDAPDTSQLPDETMIPDVQQLPDSNEPARSEMDPANNETYYEQGPNDITNFDHTFSPLQ